MEFAPVALATGAFLLRHLSLVDRLRLARARIVVRTTSSLKQGASTWEWPSMFSGLGTGSFFPNADPYLGMVWWAAPATAIPPAAAPNPLWKINGTGSPTPGYPKKIQFARPSSKHQGGVNVVFCDQHARFVGDTIDYLVYALMMTPAGAGCQPPVGSVNPIANYPPYQKTSFDMPD